MSPAGVLRPTRAVLAFHPDDLEWFEGAHPARPAAGEAVGDNRGRQLAPTEGLTGARPPRLAGHRLSPRREPCAGRPAPRRCRRLALCNDRLATPTRCPGGSSVPHVTAGRRSPSSSTGCRRTPAVRCPRTCAGCSRTRACPRRTCSSSPRRRRGRPPSGTGARPARAWLDDLAADAQARAALVRRTLRGALASLRPCGPRRGSRGPAALGCCRASGGGRRRVRCGRTEVEAALRSGSSFAVRCSRAGTRWSAPET